MASPSRLFRSGLIDLKSHLRVAFYIAITISGCARVVVVEGDLIRGQTATDKVAGMSQDNDRDVVSNVADAFQAQLQARNKAAQGEQVSY